LMTSMFFFDVYNNTGLCGDLVSVGSVGTNYHCEDSDGNSCDGLGNTNLGCACATGCPSEAPTVTTEAPTVTTEAPTVTTEAPTITTEAPTGTTETPTVTTEAPTGTTTVSPTLTDPSLDADGRNGIMRAAMSGNQTDMTTALADSVQNINHMDAAEFGYNALMLAAQYDHQDVARMLLDAGAATGLLTSTDGVEENNWSNVMVAAWYGDEEITEMFLTASTDFMDTSSDYYHMSPLHAAVSRGHSRTTSVLTSFGAKVNALDSENMTPLHYAAKIGHFKCAKTLLAAGAYKHLVDADGKTACDYAAEGENHDQHHRDIQALLGSCDSPPPPPQTILE